MSRAGRAQSIFRWRTIQIGAPSGVVILCGWRVVRGGFDPPTFRFSGGRSSD
jgi:hypothetical protein